MAEYKWEVKFTAWVIVKASDEREALQEAELQLADELQPLPDLTNLFEIEAWQIDD